MEKEFLSPTPTFTPKYFHLWALKHAAWAVLAEDQLVQTLPYQLIYRSKKSVNSSYIDLSTGGWGVEMGRYWLFQSLAA